MNPTSSPRASGETLLFLTDEQLRQGIEATRDARKKSSNDECKVTHTLRVVANEFHSFGIVAHGIQNSAQWRLGERIHECNTDEGVDGNQIVDLDLRSIGDAPNCLASYAIA